MNDPLIVIPYQRHPTRQANFDWIKAWAESRYETVAVIQPQNAKFSKSKMINRGVTGKLDNRIIVLLDADSFVCDESLASAIKLAEDHPGIIYPFNRLARLNQRQTEAVLKLTPAIDVAANLKFESASVRSPGGIVVVHSDTFRQVNGMDERFGGWGGEDSAFKIAVERVVAKSTRIDGTLFHLNHRKNSFRPVSNRKLYKRYLRSKNIENLIVEPGAGIL